MTYVNNYDSCFSQVLPTYNFPKKLFILLLFVLTPGIIGFEMLILKFTKKIRFSHSGKPGKCFTYHNLFLPLIVDLFLKYNLNKSLSLFQFQFFFNLQFSNGTSWCLKNVFLALI